MLGMFKSLHTNDSPLNLLDLDTIAKQTSLIQRKTQGFSALSIIIALIKCLQKGDASFQHIALEMSKINTSSICRGAVFKRVNGLLMHYLQAVISKILTLNYSIEENSSSAQKFQRILIEDSTFVPMGAINAANFPGHGNSNGVTAGFKLDLAFDALNNHILHQQFSPARESDKKLGKQLIENIQPNDLVLRDMGYFSIESFSNIEAQSAFWISRLPSSINVLLENGKSLESKLRLRKNDYIDEVVTLGLDGSFKARLVGVRADDQTAETRRRSRRETAQKFGNTPRNQSLIRDGWHLILTNLDTSVSSKELFDFYATRWRVETKFKAWKQALNLKPTLKRYSNYHHLACIALAGLIHQLITTHIFSMIQSVSRRTLSYEKLSEVISSYFSSLTLSTLSDPITMEERYIRMDRRSRKSLMDKLQLLK
ncbi:IS4 family transposase [Rubritalea tangerina]|uniref:IS4 family transposase n=3 Tax=Bacteria TaxID=2 RepID=UPI003617A1F9